MSKRWQWRPRPDAETKVRLSQMSQLKPSERAQYVTKYDDWFEQSLAIDAGYSAMKEAALEQKRRQMHEDFEPLRPVKAERVAPWGQVFVALLVIMLILHCWHHDIFDIR